VLSLVAWVWLGALALDGGNGGEVVGSAPHGQNAVGAPKLNEDPKAEYSAHPNSGAIGSFLYVIGSLVSGVLFLASVILFRVEVRQAKGANRRRQDRLDYYKDLKEYKVQLRGPPRDNT
jgi:hypothetical protein